MPNNLIDPFGPPPPPRPVPYPVPVPVPAVTPPAPPVHSLAGCLPSFSNVLNVVLLTALIVFGAAWYAETHHRPTPTPPAPAPAPITGTLWVTLVHDSEHPTQEFAQLEADPSLAAGLNGLGAHLRNLDVTSGWLDKKNLREYVTKAGGPPVLIVQAEGSKVVKAVKCPATAGDVVGVVKAYRDGK